MKAIIAVWNNHAQGKTETLKNIREMLRNKGATTVWEKNGRKDINIVLKLGSLKIGITSKGDPKTGVEERLLNLVGRNCKVIFCATRTSGSSYTDVVKVSKEYRYKVVWSSTYTTEVVPWQTRLNKIKARHLISLMSKITKL